MSKEARYTKFSGHVQGVGFRFTTQRIASRHGLTGYVRNMPEGSVEALFQGEKGDIDACISDIQESFHGHIRDTQSQEQDYEASFEQFMIKH
jgi:acylphosphatase